MIKAEEYFWENLSKHNLTLKNTINRQNVDFDKIIQTLQQYADVAVREIGQKQCNNCSTDGSFCPTKSIIPCPYWKLNKLKAS